MLVEFIDKTGKNRHNEFQKWRRANRNGSFLHGKSKTLFNLHVSTCEHLGNSKWTFEESGQSLTKKRKVCSNSQAELLAWATTHGVTVHACQDCLPNYTDETRKVFDKTAQIQHEVLDIPHLPEVIEGIAREIRVVTKSRSDSLRKRALQNAKGVCAVCETDFTKLIDGRGVRVLQVHHKNQLALRDEPSATNVSDLAVVCANCHCLLHLDMKKTLSIDELKRLIAGHR